MRGAAALGLLLALASCAAAPSPPPPETPPVAVDTPGLRPCPPPVPPPPVPPVPRTVEQLATYANAEARARWETADRLRTCALQMQRAINWVDRLRAWLLLGQDSPTPPP